MAQIDVSIIIPSYSSRFTLGLCLDSVKNQRCNLNYEIIVVDCSPGDAEEKIASRYKNVTFIKERNKFTPGIGRNIGAKKASGELLIFIDSDVVVNNDAVDAAWGYYKKGYNIFGGAMDIMKYPGLSLAAIIEHLFFEHEFQRTRSFRRRKYIGSNLLAFEKKQFYDIGGFADIPRMQDSELCLRLKAKKINVWFVPEFSARMMYETNFSKLWEKIFIVGNNTYCIKYLGKSTPIIKVLLYVLIPLLAFQKTLRINVNNSIFGGIRGGLLALIASPFIFFYGIPWMLGMYNAIMFQRGLSKDR